MHHTRTGYRLTAFSVLVAVALLLTAAAPARAATCGTTNDDGIEPGLLAFDSYSVRTEAWALGGTARRSSNGGAVPMRLNVTLYDAPPTTPVTSNLQCGPAQFRWAGGVSSTFKLSDRTVNDDGVWAGPLIGWLLPFQSAPRRTTTSSDNDDTGARTVRDAAAKCTDFGTFQRVKTLTVALTPRVFSILNLTAAIKTSCPGVTTALAAGMQLVGSVPGDTSTSYTVPSATALQATAGQGSLQWTLTDPPCPMTWSVAIDGTRVAAALAAQMTAGTCTATASSTTTTAATTTTSTTTTAVPTTTTTTTATTTTSAMSTSTTTTMTSTPTTTSIVTPSPVLTLDATGLTELLLGGSVTVEVAIQIEAEVEAHLEPWMWVPQVAAYGLAILLLLTHMYNGDDSVPPQVTEVREEGGWHRPLELTLYSLSLVDVALWLSAVAMLASAAGLGIVLAIEQGRRNAVGTADATIALAVLFSAGAPLLIFCAFAATRGRSTVGVNACFLLIGRMMTRALGVGLCCGAWYRGFYTNAGFFFALIWVCEVSQWSTVARSAIDDSLSLDSLIESPVPGGVDGTAQYDGQAGQLAADTASLVAPRLVALYADASSPPGQQLLNMLAMFSARPGRAFATILYLFLPVTAPIGTALCRFHATAATLGEASTRRHQQGLTGSSTSGSGVEMHTPGRGPARFQSGSGAPRYAPLDASIGISETVEEYDSATAIHWPQILCDTIGQSVLAGLIATGHAPLMPLAVAFVVLQFVCLLRSFAGVFERASAAAAMIAVYSSGNMNGGSSIDPTTGMAPVAPPSAPLGGGGSSSALGATPTTTKKIVFACFLHGCAGMIKYVARPTARVIAFAAADDVAESPSGRGGLASRSAAGLFGSTSAGAAKRLPMLDYGVRSYDGGVAPTVPAVGRFNDHRSASAGLYGGGGGTSVVMPPSVASTQNTAIAMVAPPPPPPPGPPPTSSAFGSTGAAPVPTRYTAMATSPQSYQEPRHINAAAGRPSPYAAPLTSLTSTAGTAGGVAVLPSFAPVRSSALPAASSTSAGNSTAAPISLGGGGLGGLGLNFGGARTTSSGTGGGAGITASSAMPPPTSGTSGLNTSPSHRAGAAATPVGAAAAASASTPASSGANPMLLYYGAPPSGNGVRTSVTPPRSPPAAPRATSPSGVAAPNSHVETRSRAFAEALRGMRDV